MYREFYAVQDRSLRRQDLADRTAHRRRYARPEGRPSVRARLARQLFALAVFAERDETWRAVWERLEVPRP